MFNVIVITPENNHPNESEILFHLIKDYNCTIHIRKPNFSLDAYNAYLHKHNKLLSNFVLHEHHFLSNEFPVKGIHLKERDRTNPVAIDQSSTIVSTSIHSIEDTSILTHPYEYIFFSPLFESISKTKYGSNQTKEALTNTIAKLKENTAIPIIGLGGIDAGNIVKVKECGFDGAAVLGSVWEQSDPLASFDTIYSSVIK